MSENSQNQYFQEYNLFPNDSNPQLAMINSLQEESSLFKDLQQPFPPQRFQNLSQIQPQKIAIQLTQAQTKPKLNVGNQISPGTQAIPQKIIFKPTILSDHKIVFKGTKDDTVELNTNFKTILSNFLKELSVANQLNDFQLEQFQQFSKRVPSFRSLKELFSAKTQHQRLRRVCLQFIESGKCMKRILMSRCNLTTKLQMVKYIQKLGLNIKRRQIFKWKGILRQKLFQ